MGVDGLLSVNNTSSDECSFEVRASLEVDGRGQKSEETPHFSAPYKYYEFYTT
jgi:hypothetical protein